MEFFASGEQVWFSEVSPRPRAKATASASANALLPPGHSKPIQMPLAVQNSFGAQKPHSSVWPQPSLALPQERLSQGSSFGMHTSPVH